MNGTVWLTGYSGAGKSTVALALQHKVESLGSRTYLLDGDVLRTGLCGDLGYDEASRVENVRRMGEVALLFARSGHLAIVSAISPYAAGRRQARVRHESSGVAFVEVHVATPLAICEARDPKGLYRRARQGELESFTGVSHPYEAPDSPELVLLTTGTAEEAAEEVIGALRAHGLVAGFR